MTSRLSDLRAVQYAQDAAGGRIVVGHKVKLAAERFLRELGAQRYRWKFDPELAERPIRFMERFLVPSKGDYDRFQLLPWQCFCESNIYGWVDPKTGYRRFREGIILVGSGNGKSTLVSGNAIYGACKDGERGAEVYCLANSRDQAKIVSRSAAEAIKASPLLSKHLRVTRDGIFYDATNSSITALATDITNMDGKNVHMAIFDEIQEYRDYGLINIIKPKMKKRRQPLALYISTFGNVIDGVLMDLYVLAGKILAQDAAISPRVADRLFAYIAEIDEFDKPEDESAWVKANPSLGHLLDIETLRDEWERVRLVPSERGNFINKQLNVFTTVDEQSYLSAETILANNRTYDTERLRGATCYGGFDLSDSEDFTAAALIFPLPEGDFYVLHHSWTTAKKVQQDREKLDWRQLQADGVLTVVDEEYIDHRHVVEWFDEQAKNYYIAVIGYDPAKAYRMVDEMRMRYTMDVVRQGEITLTAPLDDLKNQFLSRRVIHNGDKLYSWYLGNVKLTKRSDGGTYLPTTKNRYRKIDGFMASLDAYTVLLRGLKTRIDPDKNLTTIISLD